MSMQISTANSTWDNWKRTLGQAMEFAEELGIPREQISSMAMQVGDLLAKNVPPANPEQKTIKELWDVATQEERQVLANLMTKVSSNK